MTKQCSRKNLYHLRLDLRNHKLNKTREQSGQKIYHNFRKQNINHLHREEQSPVLRKDSNTWISPWTESHKILSKNKGPKRDNLNSEKSFHKKIDYLLLCRSHFLHLPDFCFVYFLVQASQTPLYVINCKSFCKTRLQALKTCWKCNIFWKTFFSRILLKKRKT